jgi:hypothetical protein
MGMAPAQSMEIAPTSAKRRPGSAPAKDPLRSRVGNGSALIPGIDGRSVWVRRCKELIADHLSDNPDASVAERSIIRRAAVLTVELEQLEKKFALAGEANADQLDIYARIASNLRRLLEAVGLKRQARQVDGLTLGELYRLDEQQQRAAKAAAAAPAIDADEVVP